ncbi:aminotransferase class III-fold pyridoxal phosphate-dependent enzyme [Nubsella zeaxanthinifaciens]|uniref:aminotransferase class III-fold pyridoxal phosphate-dependent enzyme n=1 Tax=Nubsella zeaxanthinifaciens TaxID=392412 RepID=UPI003D01C50C
MKQKEEKIEIDTMENESKSVSPSFSVEEAGFVLKKFWNIEGSFKPLDSYLDQNFLIKSIEGKKYVLKIANINTAEDELDLQNKALLFLQAKQIPKLVRSLDGQEMINHHSHWWRVLEFIEGKMLSDVPFHSDVLLKNIAEFSANLSVQLSQFSHKAAERFIQWDLQQATKLIKSWIDYFEDPVLKEQILNIAHHFEAKKDEIQNLRKSIVHGDLTRYNILLDDDGKDISGIIDFGDICMSWSVSEVAVLLLESIITGSKTPFSDAHKVLKIYHNIFPITEKEARLLFSFIKLRSAIIVCACARQLNMDPQNLYIKKQFEVDAKVFQNLLEYDENFVTALLMDACGYTFFKTKDNRKTASYLVETNDFQMIDISPKSDIYDDGACKNPRLFFKNIQHKLQQNFGYTAYFSPFISFGENNDTEQATIALGSYVFLPENTVLKAPSKLTFIAQTDKKSTFLAEDIYLHIDGIEHQLKINESVSEGAELGKVMPVSAESLFPSHVFIQLDKSGKAPMFCKPSEKKGWQLICEDPLFLIGKISGKFLENTDHLLLKRETFIQQSQEYYYQKPMNLVRGWKQYLYDENGQVYLDAINNVAHIGHSHPKITETAVNQLKKLNTNARFLYKENIAYAEKLLSFFPPSLQVIFFTCTGSEANDLALRLARCYTSEQDVIVIDGEYHGNTTAVDEISTCLMDNPTASKSKRSFTHPLIQPNTFRGKYRENSTDVAQLYANDVTEKINEIKSLGRNVAAFISESLLGSGGGVEMPKTYLKKVYETVKKAGGVCIADEVQIGFGRMGTHFWGFEKEDVLPDIVTLGKPMGNGYPISAVVTTKEIANAYQKKYTYFNTYSGNAVACEIASTVLDVIQEEKLQENALQTGEYLKNELKKLIEDYNSVGAVYGHAMYLGVDIVKDKKTREPDSSKALLICEAMKQNGIIIYPTGDFYNILKIKPPMCFSRLDADFLVGKLREILSIMDN